MAVLFKRFTATASLIVCGLLVPQPRHFSPFDFIENKLASPVKEERELGLAIQHLRLTPIGFQLTEQASALLRNVRWGNVSHVDQMIRLGFKNSDLMGSAHPAFLEIHLRKGQEINAVTLDLAHELTHALYSQWRPRLPMASVDEFIFSQLEGAGGEVDARFIECQVWLQMKEAFLDVDRRCSDLDLSYRSLKESFFYLGDYAMNFRSWLEAKENQGSQSIQKKIRAQPILFQSATRGLPYPISLTLDYFEMRAEVCRLRPDQCPG